MPRRRWSSGSAQRWRRLKAIKGTHPFTAIAALHAQALEALSRTMASAAAFASEDGVELAEAFEEIAEQSDDLRAAPGDYADLFETAISDRVCRRAGRPGARVHILGTTRGAARSRRPHRARRAGRRRVAARGAQRSVAVAADAARARPRSARAAHRLVGARLRAAARHAGSHPHPRRRSSRRADGRVALHAAARGRRRRERWKDALRRAASNISNWARDLDRADTVKPVARPRPRPPLDARPKQLSVTEIEHWLRDPYTIYAKHILKLRPLDAVDTPPGARDRGTVIHGAIGEFTEKYAKGLPADPLGALTRARREAFRAAAGLSRGARVLVAALPAHRALVRRLGGAAARQCERAACRGAGRTDDPDRQTDFQADHARRPHRAAAPTARSRSSTTRPARRRPSRRCAPGSRRSSRLKARSCARAGSRASRRVRSASSPMCRCAGASRRAKRSRSSSRRARRTRTPTWRWRKLRSVVERFADVKTPYRSLVSPMWKTRYGDYDHLARVAEWSRRRRGRGRRWT